MGFPDSSVIKNRLQCRRPRFNFSVRKICWRRDGLSTPIFLGFPCGSNGKKKKNKSASNERDLDSVSGLGRSPGEGKGYPLQYSGLENSMDYIVHGVAKTWTRLSNFQSINIQYCYWEQKQVKRLLLPALQYFFSGRFD